MVIKNDVAMPSSPTYNVVYIVQYRGEKKRIKITTFEWNFCYFIFFLHVSLNESVSGLVDGFFHNGFV